MRGEYDGRGVPVGFTVERKTKGVIRKYHVYEPHAEVVRWIFKRYRELGGNFAILYREIAARAYLFPFFPDGMYVPSMKLGKNEHGYIMTTVGVKGLLTNVAYIGYWYVEGHPLCKDNHPVLVDEGDFWFAFDRLSPVDIDGTPREQPVERARYNKVGTILCDALLNGIVTSEGMYEVYVLQHAEKPNGAAYVITNNKHDGSNRVLGSVQVKKLDALFTTYLLEKLEAGKGLRQQFAGTQWASGLDGIEVVMSKQLIDIANVRMDNTAGIVAQIAEYTVEAESLDRTLHYGAKNLSPKKIEEYAERLSKLHRSIDQLEAKQKRAQRAQEDLQKFVEKLDDIPAVWHTMGKEDGTTFEKQQRFIRLVTNTVTLTRVAPNWLLLDIAWLSSDAPNSYCYIWQRQGKGRDKWTDEENSALRKMYQFSNRLEILHALPTRNWAAIMIQARHLGLSRPYQWSNSGLHHTLSLDDVAFMERVGITFTPGVRFWWQEVDIPTIYTDESSL